MHVHRCLGKAVFLRGIMTAFLFIIVKGISRKSLPFVPYKRPCLTSAVEQCFEELFTFSRSYFWIWNSSGRVKRPFTLPFLCVLVSTMHVHQYFIKAISSYIRMLSSTFYANGNKKKTETSNLPSPIASSPPQHRLTGVLQRQPYITSRIIPRCAPSTNKRPRRGTSTVYEQPC